MSDEIGKIDCQNQRKNDCELGTVDWVIQKNDDCISDGGGHIKCNGYAGLCVDAKLWYVYAVVLARLCVRHGNWNIAMNSQRIE